MSRLKYVQVLQCINYLSGALECLHRQKLTVDRTSFTPKVPPAVGFRQWETSFAQSNKPSRSDQHYRTHVKMDVLY